MQALPKRRNHAGDELRSAWTLDLPRAGVAVQSDIEQGLLFVQRVRRVNLTGVRSALNGYQKGCCFYCQSEIPLTTVDVDHFFPWTLKERGYLPDADGVWNLVLACWHCNRGERGKHYSVPSARLVARLHERNNWLVASHHPLRETIMLQTKTNLRMPELPFFEHGSRLPSMH